MLYCRDIHQLYPDADDCCYTTHADWNDEEPYEDVNVVRLPDGTNCAVCWRLREWLEAHAGAIDLDSWPSGWFPPDEQVNRMYPLE